MLTTILKGELMEDKKQYVFDSSYFNIPADDKKEKGGEDSWYHDKNVLSVADGVGGWNLRGIDPSKYSRKLTKNIKELVDSDREKYIQNAKLLLVEAAQKNDEIGSSTFVVLTLDNNEQKVKTANVGDSGFIILKKNEKGDYNIKYESVSQQHSFNFPFQLGTNADDPNNAETMDFKIKEDDLYIVYSDGVCDNLYSYEVEKIINDTFRKGASLNVLGEVIANVAYKKSKISDFLSPFAKGAQEQGMYFMGGKQDDITVVVGRIRLSDNNEVISTAAESINTNDESVMENSTEKGNATEADTDEHKNTVETDEETETGAQTTTTDTS